MIHIVDTETTGLKHSHGHRAFAIGYTDEKDEPIALYPDSGSTGHVKYLMGDIASEWVGFNIGFDLPFLADYDLTPLGRLHDMQIAAHVYNNLEPDKDLASLATKYCKMSNDEDVLLEKWFKDHGYTKHNKDYSKVPREIMTPYLKADLIRTRALYYFYKSKGVLVDPAYLEEMRVMPCVKNIGQRGMRVDVAFAKEEFNKAVEIIANLETRAHLEYGIENIGSVHQIADALFTRGGLICTTFTEKGNISLDESAIQKYEHPVVDLVLEHREICKITNTYLAAIIDKSFNGRLHSNLNQIGARTGRFSSSDPNLQNIPRYDERSPINLRRAFICSEGCKLLLIDLSQIELRILAHYAKDPDMIKILTDRKGDLHKATAIAMFGETNDELRTISKTINFAVIYGAGGAGLQKQINKALPNRKVTLSQAKDFKAKFFKARPMVQQLTWDVQGRIADRGYVMGKSGRKYYCEKTSAYRALNYLIQGESAMLMKKVMIDVETYLANKSSKIINVIHDEVMIDSHINEGYTIPEIMKNVENFTDWRVPIYATATISETNWSEKKSLSCQVS